MPLERVPMGLALPFSAMFASHMRIVPSSDPEAIRELSGDQATEQTESVCLTNGFPTRSPVSASQTRIVLSDDPETIHLPSCENATDSTESVCPERVLTGGLEKSGCEVVLLRLYVVEKHTDRNSL